MPEQGSKLRSWRERIGAPLRESQNDVSEENSVRKIKSSAKYPSPSSEFAELGVRKTSAKSDVRPQNTPTQIVKDAAYWASRCWRSGCESEPADQQSERFKGRYCAPCRAAVEADAARINAEFGVLV